jgi:methyl acetate hydrolase
MSMTKAIGSLAAMILIDRGLVSMETPVISAVPEFNDIKVLDSIGPDGPGTACAA